MLESSPLPGFHLSLAPRVWSSWRLQFAVPLGVGDLAKPISSTAVPGSKVLTRPTGTHLPQILKVWTMGPRALLLLLKGALAVEKTWPGERWTGGKGLCQAGARGPGREEGPPTKAPLRSPRPRPPAAPRPRPGLCSPVPPCSPPFGAPSFALPAVSTWSLGKAPGGALGGVSALPFPQASPP